VLYKCTDYYAPSCEGALRWNDRTLAIDWPLPPDEISTNARDSSAALLADFDSPFVYGQVA
jgi:dTDP-4-dehydrorhamnose 3,5-epimerase